LWSAHTSREEIASRNATLAALGWVLGDEDAPLGNLLKNLRALKHCHDLGLPAARWKEFLNS
jgi:hypothetical protein